MKKHGFILVLLFVSANICSQEFMEEEKHSWWYPSIHLLVAAPTDEFKDAIEKTTLWGFNFDVAFRPVKGASFFQPGAKFEFLFPSAKNDRWKGAKINTTSALIKANLFTRFKFLEGSKFSPFVEGGFGFNISSTSTTTTIVDEATFFEEFFLGEEDQVETETLLKHDDSNHNAYVGVGFVINQIFSVMFKYSYGPGMEYIIKDNIVINNHAIDYIPVSAPYKTYEIAIGLSFEKVNQLMK